MNRQEVRLLRAEYKSMDINTQNIIEYTTSDGRYKVVPDLYDLDFDDE